MRVCGADCSWQARQAPHGGGRGSHSALVFKAWVHGRLSEAEAADPGNCQRPAQHSDTPWWCCRRLAVWLRGASSCYCCATRLTYSSHLSWIFLLQCLYALRQLPCSSLQGDFALVRTTRVAISSITSSGIAVAWGDPQAAWTHALHDTIMSCLK